MRARIEDFMMQVSFGAMLKSPRAKSWLPGGGCGRDHAEGAVLEPVAGKAPVGCSLAAEGVERPGLRRRLVIGSADRDLGPATRRAFADLAPGVEPAPACGAVHSVCR
jgi:hypothetical protein